MKDRQLDLDTLCDFAKQRIQENGDHDATFIIEPRRDEPCGVLFGDMQDKKGTRIALEKAIDDRDADTYYSIFTGWMVEKAPGEEIEERPSESPDRIEILIVTKYHRTNGMDSRLFRISRNRNGSVTFGEVEEITETASLIETEWNIFQRKQVNLNVLNGIEELK